MKDRADEDAARRKVGAHNVLFNILPCDVPIRSLLVAVQCNLDLHHIFHGFRLGAISMDRIVRGRGRMEMLRGAKEHPEPKKSLWSHVPVVLSVKGEDIPLWFHLVWFGGLFF